MDRARRGAVVRELRTLFSAGATCGLSDAQLLERFVSCSGEPAELAFEALVSRHGPMVFDVCYKILGNSHDVQDAFQSTFLILAVKAGSIRRQESIASWLFKVALRVASHARSEAARRRVGERRLSAMANLDVDWTPPEDRESVEILHPKQVLRTMVWIQLTRACSAVLMAATVAGFSGLMLARAGLSADKGSSVRQTEAPPPSLKAAGPVILSPSSAFSRESRGQAGPSSSTQSHLPEHPKVLWKFPTFGDPGTVLLADGVVYFGDRYESFYAVRLSDRAFLWRNQGLGHVYLPAAKHGDTVYVTSRFGLTALAAKDGKVLWNVKGRGDAMGASPLVVGDRVIVADESGWVYAIGPDGRRIWEHDTMDDEESRRERDFVMRIRADLKRGRGAANPRPPVSDGTTVILPRFDKSHRVLAIDVNKGFRRWTFQAAGMLYGKPTLADDKVFFGCYEGDDAKTGRFYCLNKRRKVLWEFPTAARIDAGSAYRDGSIFFGSSGGRFYRVNAETGKEIWSYQIADVHGTNAAIYCTPLCTEDAVYFNSFDGHLYCLKIASGELKWRFEPVAGSEVDLSLETDGQRIVVGVRRNSETKKGEDAIVVIGEDEKAGGNRAGSKN